MQMIKGWALCLLVYPFLACTNLKPVQLFSEEALKGLDQFHELDYGFTTSCLGDCTFDRISHYSIERDIQCNCSDYEKADSLVSDLYHTLINYWDGLYRLSSSELIRYQLDMPAASLAGAGWNQLDPEQLNAYQKLSEMGINAASGKYRRKKLVRYMNEADPHISLISEKLTFVLEKNLLGILDIQEESWYMYYKTQVLDASLNTIEKELAAERYYQLKDNAARIRKKTLLLVRILHHLSETHHLFTAEDMDINGDIFKDGVRSLANDLNELHYALEQLKQ